MVAVADADGVFAEQRGRLFGVAYRILGQVGDAEDVVQEAWLRWRGVEVAEVRNPEGFLVRVATRLAIDRLRSAQARREAYVGPWLPEPVLTAPDVADDVARVDSLSTAMLVVMEALSPLERAVYVLHEAFGYPFAEIGRFLDRSEAAVRQSAARARRHLEERRAVHATDTAADRRAADARRAAEAFVAASSGGEMDGLLRVLAPDVVMTCDGGGLAPAPRRAISGAELVLRSLVVFAGRTPGAEVRLVDLNGAPAVVVDQGGVPAAAITLQVEDGLITALNLVSNPEKLTGLGVARTLADLR